MVRVAIACALAGLVAAALPSPGLFAAIGMGIAAIGLGWLGWRNKHAAGASRLGGAAAMMVGGVALALGALRVALVLVAIQHAAAAIG